MLISIWQLWTNLTWGKNANLSCVIRFFIPCVYLFVGVILQDRNFVRPSTSCLLFALPMLSWKPQVRTSDLISILHDPLSSSSYWAAAKTVKISPRLTPPQAFSLLQALCHIKECSSNIHLLCSGSKRPESDVAGGTESSESEVSQDLKHWYFLVNSLLLKHNGSGRRRGAWDVGVSWRACSWPWQRQWRL